MLEFLIIFVYFLLLLETLSVSVSCILRFYWYTSLGLALLASQYTDPRIIVLCPPFFSSYISCFHDYFVCYQYSHPYFLKNYCLQGIFFLWIWSDFLINIIFWGHVLFHATNLYVLIHVIRPFIFKVITEMLVYKMATSLFVFCFLWPLFFSVSLFSPFCGLLEQFGGVCVDLVLMLFIAL